MKPTNYMTSTNDLLTAENMIFLNVTNSLCLQTQWQCDDYSRGPLKTVSYPSILDNYGTTQLSSDVLL